jgi:hypothetical protein
MAAMTALPRLPLPSSRLWLVLALLGLAACERSHEFEVTQRSTVSVPGFDGRVQVSVGDIKRGRRADIRITGPAHENLASERNVHNGSSLRFEFEGRAYQLKVSDYEDHLFGDDIAHLKITGLSEEQLARIAQPPAPSPPAPAVKEPVEQSLASSEPPAAASTSPELGLAVVPASLEAGGSSCGTSQPTVRERIADCAKQQGDNPAGLGPTDGGAPLWQLVTRTASGRQVWLQVRTGKLWSDRLGNGPVDMAGWCRARGETGTSVKGHCTPERAAAAGAPAFAYAQVSPPESWCAEQTEFITPVRFDESKGGMRRTATKHSPSVVWSLPTEEEWTAAKADGAAAVLPHGQDPLFWPASLVKHGVMSVVNKVIEARAGTTPAQSAQMAAVGTVLAVRCVGTLSP